MKDVIQRTVRFNPVIQLRTPFTEVIQTLVRFNPVIQLKVQQ